MTLSRQTKLLFSFLLHFKYYRRTKKLLDRDDFNRKEAIDAYQFQQLENLISYSYNHVPYYKKLFDQTGFHPDDFKSISDLKRIPFLTKQIIRENQQDLISTSISKRCIKRVQTGGTTGMPLEFLLDNRYATLAEMVFLRHLWNRIGYRQRDKCVVLREDHVPRIIEGKKYWIRRLLTNWLVMSAIHLNSDTFQLFYEKILAYKPRFILAFPSNAYLLARYMKENHHRPIPSLRGVICASESLYDWQRTYMEEVFQARIFSYYGHSEKCVLASECSKSECFEFYPQYGFVELINENEEDCSKEDERGEIVATGFNNYVSPFIRYKTDDVGTYTIKAGYDNPNWFNIKRIEGRIQDFLVDRDGVPKTYMHIDRPFWKIHERVIAYQYIQQVPGKVRLNIHARDLLSEAEIEKIRAVFYKTYFKIELEIEQVDHISRSSSGKFRYLIQHIKTVESTGDQLNQ